MIGAPDRVLKHVVWHSKGALKVAYILDQQAAGLVGLEKTLVCVQRYRVRTLDAEHQLLSMLDQDGTNAKNQGCSRSGITSPWIQPSRSASCRIGKLWQAVVASCNRVIMGKHMHPCRLRGHFGNEGI